MREITTINQNASVKKLSFILGLTSIISQVVILRELIIIFYGNETAYAVILASWLFWVSAGSFLVSLFIKKINKPLNLIFYFQGLIFFMLPLTIVAIRTVKYFLHVPIGEMVSLFQMCTAAFLLLFPVSILIGGLYSLICLYSAQKESDDTPSRGISTVYLWESKGAAVGGVFFSFILIHFLPSMHIIFSIGLINLFSCYMLTKKEYLKIKPMHVLVSLVVILITVNIAGMLDKASRKVQWRGLEIVKIEDSIYGNIALTKLRNEYSLYENGLLSFSTKDDLVSEENIHFAMLESRDPHKVLLIGNGIGGAIREILKHPNTTVDYVDLDPKVISVSKKYLPKENTVILDNKLRVKVFILDARYFVKTSKNKYDVIIVNLPDPSTGLINRYYTSDFFREASRVLNPNGIISLSVSSSENFLNEETKSFLRSINTTLRQVFPSVVSVPGDTNIFIACKKKGALTFDSGILAQRLKDRGVRTRFVREYYMPFKLSKDRIDYINKALSKKGEINTDMRPVAYLYDILAWSGNFNNIFKRVIKSIEWVRLKHLLLFPVLLFVLGCFMTRKTPGFPVALSIMTTGFSEMIFQIIVIIAFQSLYGFAYYRIGLIMASFMLGLVLGSLIARNLMGKGYKKIFNVYKTVQLCTCIYPLLLPYLFVVFRDSIVIERHMELFAMVFSLLPVLAGLMGGLQYPLAVEIIRRQKIAERSSARIAGFLYAFDVLGATVGALLTATLLIPLLGIKDIVIFCSALNTAVLMLLIFKKKIEKAAA